LFIGKLERLEDGLGRQEFSDLARNVFLQTGDDLWRSHISELQGLISNQMLGAASHKSAVAHYIRRCFQAWDGFRGQVIGEFLSRLLTLPIPRTDAPPSPTIQVNDDVRVLIADLPAAVAAAGD
jgi:preprotein translocase subunit SecA